MPGEQLHKKTYQLLTYLASKHPGVTVTSLVKLSYLCDLISIKRGSAQISDFEYIRYNYGPFDKKIYDYIKSLTAESVLIEESNYSPNDEYITYKHNEEDDSIFELLDNNEKEIIDGLTDSVKGYGAKMLTEIAYKTKPMEALGATLGGKEGYMEKLNLAL